MKQVLSLPDVVQNRIPELLLIAVLLGVTADLLFWGDELLGAGFLVWNVLLFTAAFAVNRQAGNHWLISVAVCSGAALLAAVVLVIRDSPVLILLMLLVMLLMAGTVAFLGSGGNLWLARLPDLFTSAAAVPVRMLTSLPVLLGRAEPGKVLPGGSAFRVIRGLLLVLPLLLVFSLLFASADVRFERQFEAFGALISEEGMQHLLAMLFCTWLATGLLLMTVCSGKSDQVSETGFAQRFRLGREETASILLALLALFLGFVLLQLEYLFGGREAIATISGLTLADYARRGFFELVAVSGLSLVVLLLLSSLTTAQKLFRPLATGLVCCVLLILVSAVQRMNLYIAEFGLTLSRVVAMVFMIWIAGVFLAFAGLVLRGITKGFAAGLMFSGVLVLLLLGFINPVALVAKTNLDRAVSGQQSLDVVYLSRLGADAVPAVLAEFEALDESTRCQVMGWIEREAGSHGQSKSDWRHWNLARARKHQQIEEFQRLADRVSSATCEALRRSMSTAPFIQKVNAS